MYLGTDTRVGSILLGAALAAFLVWRGPLRGHVARRVLEGVAIIAVSALVWAWITVSGGDTMLYRGGFALFALCAVSVIATVVHPVPGPVARALSFAPLRWLGLISYGLYLWHWPVYLVLTPSRAGVDGWALVAVRIAVSLAIAIASYFLVEMPVRRGVWSGWRIRVLTPVVATAAVLAVILATAGAVSRPAASAGATTAAVVPMPSSAAPGSLRVLVAGDSVAYHLGESFQRLDPELGFTTANVAFDGCALEHGATAARYFDGTDVPLDGHDCSAGWVDAVSRWRPDVVVLVLAGQVLGDWQIDGSWSHLCDRSYDKWYGRQIADGAAILAAQGAARGHDDTGVVDVAVGAPGPEPTHRVPGTPGTRAGPGHIHPSARSISTRSSAPTGTAAIRSTVRSCVLTASTSKAPAPTWRPGGSPRDSGRWCPTPARLLRFSRFSRSRRRRVPRRAGAVASPAGSRRAT